jgi:hypothetical protein
MDYYLYYLVIGFHLNVILSLLNFHRGIGEGYIVLPHPMIFFLTIFTWPKTLWDVIANFGKDDEDDD